MQAYWHGRGRDGWAQGGKKEVLENGRRRATLEWLAHIVLTKAEGR